MVRDFQVQMKPTFLGIPRRLVCHVSAACIAFGLIAPVTYWTLDRQVPIVIQDTSVFPPDAAPGDTIKITWTATELKGCSGTIYRRFIDSTGTIFEISPVPSIYRGLLVGGVKTFSREVRIPFGMAPGPAIYTGFREYICNPIHYLWPIRATSAVTKFNVVRKGP